MNEIEELNKFLKRYSEKSRHHQKLVNFVYPELKKIEKCNILEFGVSDQAMSTELFLKYCIKKNCNLYSIDNINYSKKFDDEKWKFILSRDDNFDYIKVQIPDIFGLILLDTIHEANHVEKIIYYYFDKLELNGCFFIDDINWIPYLKDAEKNRFYNEINNYETFQKLLEIYNSNRDNLSMEFTFEGTGMCKIKKLKSEPLKPSKKINHRQSSVKNILRKILKS